MDRWTDEWMDRWSSMLRMISSIQKGPFKTAWTPEVVWLVDQALEDYLVRTLVSANSMTLNFTDRRILDMDVRMFKKCAASSFVY